MPSTPPRSASARDGEHVVLLGDSIFDNAAYTGREPDVITHLRRLLPNGWQATLCAVDGKIALAIAGALGIETNQRAPSRVWAHAD
jgi:hypothetical protein